MIVPSPDEEAEAVKNITYDYFEKNGLEDIGIWATVKMRNNRDFPAILRKPMC
jgi:hypothetical protein